MENRSTTTIIESFPRCVLGNPSTKSMLTSIQGCSGIGNGIYNPYAFSLPLAFLQIAHLYFSFVNQYSLGGGFPFPIVLVLRYKLSLCYTPIKPDLLGFSGIDVFTCGLRVHVTTRFASSSLNLNCFYLILVDILSRLSIPLFFPHFKCIIILHIISLFILKFT